MILHTYNPQPLSLPSIVFLHLTVYEIYPGQTFSRRLPTHGFIHDTMMNVLFEFVLLCVILNLYSTTETPLLRISIIYNKALLNKCQKHNKVTN